MKEMRTLQDETLNLQHQIRTFQVDQKRQEIRHKKREMPETDLSLDEALVDKMAKYLRSESGKPCYLDKSISYPIRRNIRSDFVSNTVRKARRALLLRHQMESRSLTDLRKVQQSKSGGRSAQFTGLDRQRSYCNLHNHSTTSLDRPNLPEAPPKHPETISLLPNDRLKPPVNGYHIKDKTGQVDTPISNEAVEKPESLVLPKIDNAHGPKTVASEHHVSRERFTGGTGTMITQWKGRKEENSRPIRSHPGTAKMQGAGGISKLSLVQLKQEQMTMNRRIQNFYRLLKEDQTMAEAAERQRLQQQRNKQNALQDGGDEYYRYRQPSKARKRWDWAINKVLDNLDELLDETYRENYSFVLPSIMQNTTGADVDSTEMKAKGLQVKGRGVPSHSQERSKRHTATFKLQKIVQMVLKNKNTFEKMQYEETKQQMKGH